MGRPGPDRALRQAGLHRSAGDSAALGPLRVIPTTGCWFGPGRRYRRRNGRPSGIHRGQTCLPDRFQAAGGPAGLCPGPATASLQCRPRASTDRRPSPRGTRRAGSPSGLVPIRSASDPSPGPDGGRHPTAAYHPRHQGPNKGPDGPHRRPLGTQRCRGHPQAPRAWQQPATSKTTGATTSSRNAAASTSPAPPAMSSRSSRVRREAPTEEPHPNDFSVGCFSSEWYSTS